MWINGLTILNKPLLQFHTQYNAAAVGQHRYGLYEPEPDRARRPVRLHRRPYAPTAQRGHRPLADKEAHQRIGGWMRQAVSNRIPVI